MAFDIQDNYWHDVLRILDPASTLRKYASMLDRRSKIEKNRFNFLPEVLEKESYAGTVQNFSRLSETRSYVFFFGRKPYQSCFKT